MEKSMDKSYRSNVILNIVYKLSAIVLGLLSVNAYLKYLGSSNYGLWVTISSIASWAAVGDLGIGNGLRNELAKAYAEENKDKQRELIGASFTALLKLSIIIFVILIMVTEVMIGFGLFEPSIRAAMYITNLFMCINFAIGIVKSIAYAYQESWMASFSQFVTYLLGLAFVYALIFLNMNSNLCIFAVLNGLSAVISNLILLIMLSRKIEIPIVAKRNADKTVMRSVFGLGVQFFVLQFCGLILHSTDNVIINITMGSEAVTEYSVITRVYNTGESLFAILLISMWSAVTYQWEKGNFIWIQKKVKSMLGCWLFYSLGVVGISILFNPIIKIWLGESAIVYDKSIVILFAVYNIAGAFGAIFVNVANGIGAIRIQMICGIIAAFINIPLSIFFAKICNMGIFGVKLATLLCCFGSIVAVPVQIVLLLKRHRLSDNVLEE